MNNKKTDDIEWVDKKKEYTTVGFDERFLLKFYRICKKHYEFILGLIIGIVIMLFIIK